MDSTIQNQVELSNHDITNGFEVDNSSTSIYVASSNESIDSFSDVNDFDDELVI